MKMIAAVDPVGQRSTWAAGGNRAAKNALAGSRYTVCSDITRFYNSTSERLLNKLGLQ